MTTQDLPEAPASITLNVVTTKGYPALLTLRETTGTVLLEKVAKLETALELLGYRPQERSSNGFRKPVAYVEGQFCPKDGGRLVIKTKKSDGTNFYECENRKYDFQTKVTSGCDYIDWDAGKSKAVVGEEPPTPDKF